MSSRPQVAYKFGDFLLNPSDKQLLRDGMPVALPPKVFDTLLLLVENHAHLTTAQIDEKTCCGVD